jgi:hypothetical protein
MLSKILSQKQAAQVWVLLASGKKAEVYALRKAIHDRPSSWTRKHPFLTTGVEIVLDPVPGLRFAAEPLESFEVERHTRTPHPDLPDDIKAKLAKDISRGIETAALKNDFDHLVIAAPQKLLAQIKADLSPCVRERIMGEIPKDMTRIPNGKNLVARLDAALSAAPEAVPTKH